MFDQKEIVRTLNLLKQVDPKEYQDLLEIVGKIGSFESIERAKTDFLEFVKLMWPGVILGRHHKTMAEVIESVVLKDRKRAIVNMAPRMSKSEFFSYLMPAWYLGHNPGGKIIQVCGTADMAIGWSRKVRNLVGSEDYQKVFPGVTLRQDSKAAGRWHTGHGGEYFAVGAEGNITGKGADCLVAGTLVSTPKGDVPIEQMTVGHSVYAFDHLRGRVLVSRVIGVRNLLSSKALYEVRSAQGHSFRCTGDHRVYSPGRGYVEASRLGPGDRLLLGDPATGFRAGKENDWSSVRGLRFSCGKALVRGSEGYPEGMHRRLLPKGVQRSASFLEKLQEQVSVLFGRHKSGQAVLRRCLQEGGDGKPGRGALASKLFGLFYDLFRQTEILFARVFAGKSFPSHDRVGQFAFCANGASSLFGHAFSENERSRSGTRWVLHGLLGPRTQSRDSWRNSVKYCGASRRREPKEQQAREPDLFVPFLSSDASYDRVASVSLVGGDCEGQNRVYDIQVEGQSNFFANGVLVHNCLIIDDPTGEQQAVSALTDPSTYRKVYDWYVAGPRQRLQPGGRICVVQSRWAPNDFTGQLLKAERETEDPHADKWHVVELPAILPSGESIWPEFWTKAALEGTRLSLPPNRWNAQYMQQPSGGESALLKREYWKRWEGERPPECFFKLVTMDTAYSNKETADYTAVTTWGIFKGETDKHLRRTGGIDPGGQEIDCLILLDAWKERINFPDLKAAAHRHWLKWQPDVFLVEAKASGTPLIHELRARGIPVSEYTPVKGSKFAPNSKVVRANAITDILASGIVYAPQLRWADDLIEECDQFPAGDHDDFVDCVVMALMRFRQGGLIRLPTDEEWNEEPVRRWNRKYY